MFAHEVAGRSGIANQIGGHATLVPDEGGVGAGFVVGRERRRGERRSEVILKRGFIESIVQFSGKSLQNFANIQSSTHECVLKSSGRASMEKCQALRWCLSITIPFSGPFRCLKVIKGFSVTRYCSSLLASATTVSGLFG